MYAIYIIVTMKSYMHLHIYICYIQFYAIFQHIDDSADGTGSGGSGLGLGQGHPSWQLVSIWCLQFNILQFL